MSRDQGRPAASAAQAAPQPLAKPHWSTRQLVTMALLCAVGVLLSFIELPLLPGVPWLKYDASATCALVAGFAFGPGAGMAVGAVGAVIHGILLADAPGSVMNILVVAGYVLPAALIYGRRRTFAGGVVGLTAGAVMATVMAIVGNLLITPFYLGVPFSAVIDLIIPVLTPFNLVKAALNAVITLVVYKSVSRLITPEPQRGR